MKVLHVGISPLPSKHYYTEVIVKLVGSKGLANMRIEISGYYPEPSRRELENGWESEFGMDHVENEAHLVLAEMIVEALKAQGQAE